MGEAEGPGLRHGTAAARWVLLATVLGSSLAFVDATVVNIALPHIGTSLGAGPAGLQWTVNAYALTLTALLLLGGALGDRFGRRRVYVLGVVWFAAASLLCGLAPTIETLVAARALQGVGGALLTPGSLAILEATFHPDDRGRAIGTWSGLGGVAGALGPFLGGWIVEVASWRLVFLINLPVAAVVALVAHRHVPESRDPEAPRRTDLPGVLTAAAGLGGIAYGFTAWTARGPTDPAVLGALGLGATALVAFAWVERRSPTPMLPLRLFASRTFTAANVVTFVVYAALGGMIFLLVLALQVVAGFSPLAAGVSLLPITVLMLLLSARGGALAQRIGPRLPMTIGPALCASAFLLLSRLGPGATYLGAVLPGVGLVGLGLAATVAPLTATVLGAVDERHAGVASAVNNAVARAAGLLAVAVLPLAGGLGAGRLTEPADLAPVFRTAMILCAGLLLLGAGIAFLTMPAGPGPRGPPRGPTTAAWTTRRYASPDRPVGHVTPTSGNPPRGKH
jgi:EmrB/QacA subfamily drug resistance transporter